MPDSQAFPAQNLSATPPQVEAPPEQTHEPITSLAGPETQPSPVVDTEQPKGSSEPKGEVEPVKKPTASTPGVVTTPQPPKEATAPIKSDSLSDLASKLEGHMAETNKPAEDQS